MRTIKVAVVMALVLMLLFTAACSKKNNYQVILEDAAQQNSGEDAPAEPNPWENGGKKPSKYTWEEFLALDAAQQMDFQESFGSFEKFEKWMQKVNPTKTVEEEVSIETPWDKGGKQPSEYTWEEFLALSAELQMVFQESFGSSEAFEKWMLEVKPEEKEEEIAMPWENGGKKPSEYTWEEFEALEAGMQVEFQNSIGGYEEFEKWMLKVKPAEEENAESVQLPWENGKKQPSEYTWEEFLALDAELQMEFQESFGSSEAFEKWMLKEMPQQEEETENTNPSDKKPSEYTWEDFMALDDAQKETFPMEFDSLEEFNRWLQKNQP